jgi:hypothetical protein
VNDPTAAPATGDAEITNVRGITNHAHGVANDLLGITNDDQGIGLDTPGGRFSISSSSVHFGGVVRPIASVGGALSVLLIVLAVLAAFAGTAGGIAAVRRAVSNGQPLRWRAPVATAVASAAPRMGDRAPRTRGSAATAAPKPPAPRMGDPAANGRATAPPPAPARRTREQLYSEARRQNLPGRSKMTRAELERALYPARPGARL